MGSWLNHNLLSHQITTFPFLHPMLDPINALAFSVQSNKGVYAVLLGSGVSRSAGIPTGWEITLDLVRKVAALQGEVCEPDPEDWYVKRTGRQPDYSELLDLVAKTPAERQQLLRQYWEPTEQEQEDGLKLPTRAHRAIAGLVKAGYVRVIITTNFDRLTELALQEVGVQPAVLSTAGHIHGAVPLVHAPCTLIKVHGDYLDTRMLNTPDELAAYPVEINTLLDRVFDEYGLIVCGWSADWDVALRAAISRAPARRYNLYWASRGRPSAVAQDLIDRRAGQQIAIADADTFFVEASEQIQSLEDFARPHPLSTAAAVSNLKRYLSEPRHAIQLSDLIHREVDKVLKVISGPEFQVLNAPSAGPDIERRVRAFEGVAETLMRMAYVAGYWSSEEQIKPWCEAFSRLAYRQSGSGVLILIELQRYPATLVLYAFALGTVMNKRYRSLDTILSVEVQREHREPKRVVELVPPFALFQQGGQVMQVLPGREGNYAPLNDRLAEVLISLPEGRMPSIDAYDDAFDTVEILLALNFARLRDPRERYWTLPGRYGYRNGSRDRILAKLGVEVGSAEAPGPLVTSSLIGASPEECTNNISSLAAFACDLRWDF